ncbi:Uncharacterised protein [uncultured archaeon]|nr:Uncharacterised protein [uncultured archaeon]
MSLKIANIVGELPKIKNLVVISRNSDPVESMLEIVKLVSPRYRRICFVSVDKPFTVLTERFRKEEIDYSKFSFIDCISSLTLQQVVSKQCKYLDSPRALQNLALLLGEEIHKSDCIIFDNVSSLLLYNDTVPVLQFLNNLMHQINFSKLRGVFLLSHDTGKEVMEDLSLFADKVEVI